MKCDVCGNTLAVIDTKNYNEIQATRRRRECVNGHRRSTIEIPIPVIKERIRTKTVVKNLSKGIGMINAHAQAISLLDRTVRTLKSVHV